MSEAVAATAVDILPTPGDANGPAAIALPQAHSPCQCCGMPSCIRLLLLYFCCLAAAATFSVAFASAAAAQLLVDLELVLAVDVSLSMDLDEKRLPRDGYIAALRDGQVHQAITSGPHGRIVVTHMEWAGPSVQNVVIPWTLIDGPAAARAVADKLEAQPISHARTTSISQGLVFPG